MVRQDFEVNIHKHSINFKVSNTLVMLFCTKTRETFCCTNRWNRGDSAVRQLPDMQRFVAWHHLGVCTKEHLPSVRTNAYRGLWNWSPKYIKTQTRFENGYIYQYIKIVSGIYIYVNVFVYVFEDIIPIHI